MSGMPDRPSPAERAPFRVRPLAPGEARTLAGVMRRSFGGLAGLFFGRGQAAFVADQGGRVVGGVVVAAFRIDARRRGGVVKWVFALPEARGAGVAGALVDRALAWFDEQHVTDAFATIEGLNAGSSNRFAGRGFELLGFDAQLRRYGAALVRVWWHTSHLADVGHFLWARSGVPAPGGSAGPVAEGRSSEGAAADAESDAGVGLGAFAIAVALHVGIGLAMLARLGELDATAAGLVALALAAVLVARTGAMALAAWASGLRLRYRAWETGLALAAAIAAVFGGPMVVPGGLYPRARTWSARALAPGLARVAFAGAGAVVLLGWAAWGAAGVPGLAATADLVLLYARVLALFDVLLPFFPLTAFSGRRLWDASRPGWALLAVATAALWLVPDLA